MESPNALSASAFSIDQSASSSRLSPEPRADRIALPTGAQLTFRFGRVTADLAELDKPDALGIAAALDQHLVHQTTTADFSANF